MNTNRLLLIDRYIGLPLGILLNFIVRIVGQILRPDHSLDKKFERFAIVKFKGLGSILQATPLVDTIKHNYPQSELYFITSIQNKEIIEKLDGIDKAIYLNDKGLFQVIIGLPIFLLHLIKCKFQILFDLEVYSNISSILCTLSCAKNRFGYYRSASQYRMGLYTHMMFFNSSMPLSQCYLQMVRTLPIKEEHTALHRFEDRGPGRIGEYIDQSRPFIVINPNASDLRIERRWDIGSFGKVIDSIRERYSEYQVVLIGGGSEVNHVNKVIQAVSYDNDALINLAGKTNLDELIWLISRTDLFISSDTGPAHLAYCQGSKSIVMFGPVNPIQFEINSNVKVLYKEVYCSPCVHEFTNPPCHGNNQCMKMISVEEVLNAVDTMLLHGGSSSPESSPRYRDGNENTLGRLTRK